MTSIAKLFLLTGVLVSGVAHAADELNNDKVDRYQLKVGSEVAGHVVVSTKFLGEPIIMPVNVTVTVKCAKGFNKRNNLVNADWNVFDYGSLKNPKQLSNYDANSGVLTVYFFEGLVDQNGYASHGKTNQRTFNLAKTCVKN